MRIGQFGLTEILIVIVFLLLIFGAKRLPGIAQSIGTSLREFKTAILNNEKSD